MRHGELWWADAAGPSGTRPMVLLSRDRAYAVRQYVIMSPITTHARRLPTEMELGEAEGLQRLSIVNLDNLITEDKRILRERIGVLTTAKMDEVEVAIHVALGLSK